MAYPTATRGPRRAPGDAVSRLAVRLLDASAVSDAAVDAVLSTIDDAVSYYDDLVARAFDAACSQAAKSNA